MNTNNQNKTDKFYKWLQNNYAWIFPFLIFLSFISPWLFTRNWGNVDFSTTGQIGDTIGGLASPFINLLSAILIYLTFKEQIESNNLTRREFHMQEEKEEKRLGRIKEIVLWDLSKRIKPIALQIKNEVVQYIPNIGSNQMIPMVDHVDFNSDIFDANSLNDYFEVFKKEPQDLQSVANFYYRVGFIYDNIPLHAYEKLKEEKLRAATLMFQDQQHRAAYHQGLHDKYTKTMNSLILNIDNLVAQIDTFVAKYSE